MPPNHDDSSDTGDDFNAYVNGAWMATAEIPPDRPSNSVGLEVHEQATENVRVIIEESAEGDFAKGTDEQKVGDLYNAYMDMETRTARGVEPLQADFGEIAALEDYRDLAVYFAEANKSGINTPFALGQYVDFKDNNQYMMYTWQGGLGLPCVRSRWEGGCKKSNPALLGSGQALRIHGRTLQRSTRPRQMRHAPL